MVNLSSIKKNVLIRLQKPWHGLSAGTKQIWTWITGRARHLAKVISGIAKWARDTGWDISTALLLAAILLIWVKPGLGIPDVTTSNPNTLYLLSTIAQSLAAVLALVFTISLVVAQLSSRYSHRVLSDFFDRVTVIYTLFFIAAVFMPFWLLAEPSHNAVKTSLTVASAALLALVPYFLRFKSKLNPINMITDLREKAFRRLKNSQVSEPEEIVKLDNITMSAFAYKDYDTFSTGVRTLTCLTIKTYDNSTQIGEMLLKRLVRISLSTTDDPMAPVHVVQNVRKVATKIAESGLQDKALNVASILGNITIRAADRSLPDVVSEGISGLKEISLISIERSMESSVERAIELVKTSAIHCIKSGLDENVMEAVRALEAVASKAMSPAQRQWLYLVRVTWGLMSDIGTQALEHRLLTVAEEIVGFLYIGGDTFIKQRVDYAEQAATALGRVIVKVTELNDAKLAKRWIETLSRIGSSAVQGGQGPVASEVADALNRVVVNALGLKMQALIQGAIPSLCNNGLDFLKRGDYYESASSKIADTLCRIITDVTKGDINAEIAQIPLVLVKMAKWASRHHPSPLSVTKILECVRTTLAAPGRLSDGELRQMAVELWEMGASIDRLDYPSYAGEAVKTLKVIERTKEELVSEAFEKCKTSVDSKKLDSFKEYYQQNQ